MHHQFKTFTEDGNCILVMCFCTQRYIGKYTVAALHDVVAYYAPYLTSQSTYKNDKKRIDYILVSEDLPTVSTGTGHTPYYASFISDHRGVYWDIFYKALFETSQIGPIPISQRGLQLVRPKTIEIYIPYLKIMYQHHRILEQETMTNYLTRQQILQYERCFKQIIATQIWKGCGR